MKLTALLLGLLLAGCGGGGSSQPSPYQGAWAGTAGVVDGSGDSSMPDQVTLSVDRSGRMNGAWSEAAGSGTIAGSVNREGTVAITVTLPGSPPQSLGARGVSTLTTDGAWQGSLPLTDGSGSSFLFTTIKQ